MADPDEIPEVPAAEEPEDTLMEKQKGRIILAILLLGILIYLVVIVNVPAIRASAGTALVKNEWQLVSLADSSGPMVPAAGASPVTLRFREDGLLAGSSGCNYYSANYTVSEYRIVISNGFHTERGCYPPEIMAQEQHYLDNLAAVTDFRITDTDLKMYGRNGTLLLVFSPAR